MNTDTYISRYVDILSQFIKQECAEIQLDESMLNFGINSFDVIEILVALEAAFNVEFPDSLISPELFDSPQTLYNGLLTILNRKDEV